MELKVVPPPPPEDESLDDAFFTQSSIAPVEIGTEDDGSAAPPLAQGTRRAMHVTVGMLGASLIGLGGFLLYTQVLMPTPVELGTAGDPPQAPQPMAAASLPSAPAAEVAPAGAIEPSVTEPILPSTEPPAATPAPSLAGHADLAASAKLAIDDREEAAVKQAYRSLNAGDINGAIAQARRIVNGSPSRADAWLVLGSGYDRLHDRESALLAFRACALRGKGPHARTCKRLARVE